MGAKLKVTGWVALGVVAGALTTMQLQAIARSSMTPLPLEEMQQLAAVFGMVLHKKLPNDHVSEDSKDVIKLVMGLIAIMAVLVLGLRIASANSS